MSLPLSLCFSLLSFVSFSFLSLLVFQAMPCPAPCGLAARAPSEPLRAKRQGGAFAPLCFIVGAAEAAAAATTAIQTSFDYYYSYSYSHSYYCYCYLRSSSSSASSAASRLTRDGKSRRQIETAKFRASPPAGSAIRRRSCAGYQLKVMAIGPYPAPPCGRHGRIEADSKIPECERRERFGKPNTWAGTAR